MSLTHPHKQHAGDFPERTSQAELEGDGFRLLLSIERGTRGTFGHAAASLPDEPLPSTPDVQDGEITGAERRTLDWKAALR